MRTIRSGAVLLITLTVLSIGCQGGEPETEDGVRAQAPPDSTRRAVEQAIASLNEMRESLAATIDTAAVDKETFKRVCKPVGMRAKEIAGENGWVVRQVAKKYRNPANALDEEAEQLYEQFADSTTLEDTWTQAVHEGTGGWRYARRITIQPSCMACHGPATERPEFIKKGYPEDRAYDFEVGDLRGLYTVFVPARPPDTTAATVPSNAG